MMPFPEVNVLIAALVFAILCGVTALLIRNEYFGRRALVMRLMFFCLAFASAWTFWIHFGDSFYNSEKTEWMVSYLLRGLAASALTGILISLTRRQVSKKHALISCVLVVLALAPQLVGMFRSTITRVVNPSQEVAISFNSPIVRNTETGAVRFERGLAGSDFYPKQHLIIQIYTLVALALIAKLVFGLLVAQRVWDKAVPSEEGVRISDRVLVPFSLLGLRQRIVLPATSEGWTPECRAAIIAHERAHWLRQDGLTQLIGRVAIAVHWVNPLVWLLGKEQRALAELAADDMAIGTGTSPTVLSQAILDVAKLRSPNMLVAIPFASRAGLKGRIQRVLDPAAKRSGLERVAKWIAFAAVSAYAVGFNALQDTIVETNQSAFRTGKTPEPGMPSNQWVATLSDTRAVTLERIVGFDSKGKRVDWKPTGEVIPSNGVDYFGKNLPNLKGYVSVIFKFKSTRNQNDINAGTGSPTNLPGWPTPLQVIPIGGHIGYGGGGVLGTTEEKTCVSYMEWFKAAPTDTIGFYVSDADWYTAILWNHKASLPTGGLPTSLAEVVPSKTKDGKPAVTFTTVYRGSTDSPDETRCLVVDKVGTQHLVKYAASEWSTRSGQSTLTSKWTVPIRIEDLRQIQVQKRPGFHTWFGNVATMPNN